MQPPLQLYDDMLFMQDVEDVVDVEAFCAYVSYLPPGATAAFGNRRFFMNLHSQGVKAEWNSAPLWPKQSEISKDDVKNGLFQLCERDDGTMLCTISGGNKTVSSARLCLQSNQCILLDATCNGLLLKNTNFVGTVPHGTVSHAFPDKICFLRKKVHRSESVDTCRIPGECSFRYVADFAKFFNIIRYRCSWDLFRQRVGANTVLIASLSRAVSLRIPSHGFRLCRRHLGGIRSRVRRALARCQVPVQHIGRCERSCS